MLTWAGERQDLCIAELFKLLLQAELQDLDVLQSLCFLCQAAMQLQEQHI